MCYTIINDTYAIIQNETKTYFNIALFCLLHSICARSFTRAVKSIRRHRSSLLNESTNENLRK